VNTATDPISIASSTGCHFAANSTSVDNMKAVTLIAIRQMMKASNFLPNGFFASSVMCSCKRKPSSVAVLLLLLLLAAALDFGSNGAASLLLIAAGLYHCLSGRSIRGSAAPKLQGLSERKSRWRFLLLPFVAPLRIQQFDTPHHPLTLAVQNSIHSALKNPNSRRNFKISSTEQHTAEVSCSEATSTSEQA
jgi:hypothetical protein